VSFGAALAVMSALAAPVGQLVVVSEDAGSATASVARGWFRSGSVSTVVTRAQAAAFATAGFELFEGRDREAAYLCEAFVCRLPLTDPDELDRALRS
jgi:uncharacterized protein YyaL (SSP411 family)